jgi:succinoglycan biosynthesis transport protein ExoP
VNEVPRYTTLRDYLRVLREQRLVIVLITLVAGGAALFVSLRQEPAYQATSALAFQDETQQLGVPGGGSVSPNVPTGKTPQARAETIDEPPVLHAMERKLPKQVTLADLRGAITTSLNEDSFLVNVTASWKGADFAARLANDFAREASRYTNRQARQEYDAQLRDVESRLDALGSDLADQTERQALAGQAVRLRYLVENAEAAQVAETARPPDAPSAPQTQRNVALGVLLGLALGILVAFLRDTLDRRLRGSRQVQEELEFPVLGRVREHAMGRVLRPADASDDGLQPDVEALRIVRQNLEFLSAADRPVRTVVVTSPLPEEGKSTVAAALAFSSASAGKRTLLLECDLRSPDLARRLGLSRTPGLTDYLVGRAAPEEVLQLVALDPRGSSNGNGSKPADHGTGVGSVEPVVCIPSGTGSPQPAELLGSDRFERFLREVADVYDAVILDTSPVLPVADTLKLLRYGDAVLLCVRSGQTTREQATLAKSALEHVPGERPVGIVVTGLQRRHEGDHGYYSYADAYQTGAREKSTA